VTFRLRIQELAIDDWSRAAQVLSDARTIRAVPLVGLDASERAGIVTLMILAKTVLGFIELSLGNVAGADDHLRGIPEQPSDDGGS